MRAIRGLMLLAACAIAVSGAGAQDPKQREFLAAIEKQLRQTAATAGPSIACIVVSRSEFYPKGTDPQTPGKLGTFDRQEFLKNNSTPERIKLSRQLDLSRPDNVPDHGYAGGVVIDAAGYVLTPYHVIDGATRVYVFLPGGKGSYADVRAADARSDLAVLRLINPPENLTPIKFADVRTTGRNPTIATGKLCVLMANPYSSVFGIGQPSAGFGSITNVRHRITPPATRERTGAERYSEFGYLLEYDVRLNAEVSGGALMNLDSELMGLTNAGSVAFKKEIGAGYALPMDANLRRIIDVLKKGEEVEYGFLGVRPANLDDRFPQFDPRAVVPIDGGAADRAGIHKNDILKAINGAPVSSFNDLLLHVGAALAGSTLTVSVTTQDGTNRDVEVTLDKLQHELPYIASVRPDPVFGLRVEYASTRARELKGAESIAGGVFVREVAPDSPAAKQLKALGDPPTKWRVTHVNEVEVNSPPAFYKAAKGLEKVKLTVVDGTDRNQREHEVTLP